jgi:hypothetical protein
VTIRMLTTGPLLNLFNIMTLDIRLHLHLSYTYTLFLWTPHCRSSNIYTNYYNTTDAICSYVSASSTDKTFVSVTFKTVSVGTDHSVT